MNKAILGVLVVSFMAVMVSSQVHASDCNGSWNVIPNYKKSMGSPCKALGLDSNNGTCQPGQEFETLCDDKAKGMYRLCTGNNSCYNNISPKNNCAGWDYNYNMPCPQGFINVDCRGWCETRQ